MKSTIRHLIIIISIVFFLICEVTSRAIEIEFVKNFKSKRHLQKNSFRFLQENDISVEYEDDEDFFVIDVGLGTPPQVFSLQLDTTTSETWVPSLNIEDQDLVKFNVNNSKTNQLTNKTIEVEDEDGDVKGHAAYDTITIDDISVSGFGFVLVNDYEEDYDDYKQGKLGLGYKNEHKKPFSLLSHLKSNGAIDKKIFALSEVNTTHGKFHLGDYPNEYSTEKDNYTTCNLTTTDGLEDDYRDGWVCELSHVFVGEYDQNFTDAYEVGGRVIFDSGYSYINVPDTYLNYFKKSLAEAGLNLENCRQEKDEDDEDEISYTCPNSVLDPELENNAIGLLIGGYSYQISISDLFSEVDNNNSEFLVLFNKEKADIWTLGHPFLSEYTVVFDAEEDQVGFFGGDREDFYDEWEEYLEGEDTFSESNRVFYMIVGASVLGFILLIVIIFLIIHSVRRKKLEEHGPLIHERN